jgi:hypothetical protein
VKLRSLLLIAAIVLPFLLSAQTQPSESLPVIVLRRSTIVAFFVGADRAHEIDANGNESLSDFQLYAYEAKGPLKKMGIDLLDTVAPAFRIRFGKKATDKVTDLHPAQNIGYYFIAPGKEPRVEYGVRTDSELVAIARQYFGTKPGKNPGPNDLSQ